MQYTASFQCNLQHNFHSDNFLHFHNFHNFHHIHHHRILFQSSQECILLPLHHQKHIEKC